MHTIFRHSARISIRIASQRSASFSTTAGQQTSNQPPNDRDKNEQREGRPAKLQEQDVEDEVIDLGQSRRHNLRRTLRQRKAIELPPPPALPGWFLKHNVKSLNDAQRTTKFEEATDTLECTDTETGERLFTFSCPASTTEVLLQGAGADQPGNYGAIVDVDALTIDAIVSAAYALAGQSASSLSADIHLRTADGQNLQSLNSTVSQVAQRLTANLVTIDANDLADLTAEYVGSSSDVSGTFTTLAHDVYEGQAAVELIKEPTEESKEEEDDQEDEPEYQLSQDPDDDYNSARMKSIKALIESQIGSIGKSSHLRSMAFTFPRSRAPAGIISNTSYSTDRRKKGSRNTSDYVQWDDARLAAVLDQIIDAPQVVDHAAPSKRQRLSGSESGSSSQYSQLLMSNILAKPEQPIWRAIKFGRAEEPLPPTAETSDSQKRTIIHIKDMGDICQSKLGETIIARLVKLVRKRRRLGERVAIIGTSMSGTAPFEFEDMPFITVGAVSDPFSAFAGLSNSHLAGHKAKYDDRTKDINVRNIDDSFSAFTGVIEIPLVDFKAKHDDRIRQINMRNIGSMLRRLQPEQKDVELFDIPEDQILSPQGDVFSQQVLSYDDTRELLLVARGLAASHGQAISIRPLHVSLAAAVLRHSNDSEIAQSATMIENDDGKPLRMKYLEAQQKAIQMRRKSRTTDIHNKCNRYEKSLLGGMVDPLNIKVGFNDVHVGPETIEALKTATSLSLTRPDAFKYGVLARDNLSGLMLYGPPGTGKTMLAKAVAKESGAAVLEVSGAQIYQKYVGEGEKMVQAVFSLAKKLAPCVVFIDEADAIFGARDSNSSRNTHRELINQFLKEWDGMDDNKIFIMVATNRPFDIDDAVLRRLPRRLLVDLPLATDREKILGIHLRDEQLNSEISLEQLAKQTPLYSGSDLKNVCVSAALSAVREEVERTTAAERAGDEGFTLPERRTLEQKHFDKALQEISASINEDMSSLNAIKKFDEQYGDRRGRKKKASYGFGAPEVTVDETAARVRK